MKLRENKWFDDSIWNSGARLIFILANRHSALHLKNVAAAYTFSRSVFAFSVNPIHVVWKMRQMHYINYGIRYAVFYYKEEIIL